ncbi:MAG: hypothetical protein DPW14_17340, partial [Planctomycetes bacterium]|nr:hypothetical protein [Planctomycetota bacterium]
LASPLDWLEALALQALASHVLGCGDEPLRLRALIISFCIVVELHFHQATTAAALDFHGAWPADPHQKRSTSASRQAGAKQGDFSCAF